MVKFHVGFILRSSTVAHKIEENNKISDLCSLEHLPHFNLRRYYTLKKSRVKFLWIFNNIKNYKEIIKNLAKVGVIVICYNFMLIFDWTCTDLYKELPDGSNAFFFEKSQTVGVDVRDVFDRIT